MRISHGQFEGKDVADVSHGDETWMSKFVRLAMERGEGRENAWKVYAV